MALSQSFVFDPATQQTVDTRTMVTGWHGPHNSLHEATIYEQFGAVGSVTIAGVSVALGSASPVPFKVVRRGSDGTLTTVATGSLPANTLQADAGSLGLSASSFVNALPTDSYSVIPAGTVTESALRPGLFSWAEAPVDGSGFTLTMALAVQ